MNYLLIGLLAFAAVLGTTPTNQTLNSGPETCVCGENLDHPPVVSIDITGNDMGCKGGMMDTLK